MRCQEYGHDVMWYDRPRKDGTQREAGQGIIPKLRDYALLQKRYLHWADLIYLPDNVYYQDMLEPYRLQGFPIIGAGLEAAKMELDRQYGQKTMKDAGIPIMESREFHDYASAIAFVQKHPGFMVSKPSGDANKALSYVAQNPGDMVYMLERWAKREDTKALARKDGFILQEKKVGIEMAAGGWFGPGGWSKWKCENWENKKLMNGDLGVATGEMGTLVRLVEESPLFDAVVRPIEKHLRKIGYVGYIDNNCIIDAESGEPWPMEWTMRDGWPLRHNLISLQTGDPAQWMVDLLHGYDTMEVLEGQCSISLVMAIPDFPYSRLTNKDVSGIPIYNADDMDHIHLSEAKMGDVPVWDGSKIVREPGYVTSGDYVLVCTGTGATITGARRSAYSALTKVTVPNSPFYRTDIGKGRMVGQLPKLHALGYAEGLEF